MLGVGSNDGLERATNALYRALSSLEPDTKVVHAGHHVRLLQFSDNLVQEEDWKRRSRSSIP